MLVSFIEKVCQIEWLNSKFSTSAKPVTNALLVDIITNSVLLLFFPQRRCETITWKPDHCIETSQKSNMETETVLNGTGNKNMWTWFRFFCIPRETSTGDVLRKQWLRNFQPPCVKFRIRHCFSAQNTMPLRLSYASFLLLKIKQNSGYTNNFQISKLSLIFKVRPIRSIRNFQKKKLTNDPETKNRTKEESYSRLSLNP